MKTDFIIDENTSYKLYIFVISNFSFDELNDIYYNVLEIVKGHIDGFNLNQIAMVESSNPSLDFIIGSDIGISANNSLNQSFTCTLSLSGYAKMSELLLNCIQNFKDGGHYWLYDLDTEIELLLSRGGTW